MEKDQDLTAKPQANPHSPEQEEAEEFRRILQNDEIAPVDDTSYSDQSPNNLRC